MEKKKINKKSFKKPIAGIFLVCFLLSLFSFPPFSQAASQIDISAYVVSKDDAPLSGQYSIRFALYTQNRTNSSEGETTGKVWEETQRITIKDGMIKATLGSQTSFPSNLNLTQNQYFLGIKIGENSEMVPRKKISANPFSINAISASSLNGAVAGTGAGNIPLIGTGGKIDIGLLPTGEEDNQLVLSNDPRLSDTTSLSISGSPKYLTVSGETITLKKITLGTDTTGSLALTQGGTGLASYTAGDMLYYSSGGALSKITIGTNGQVLTIQNGVPIWLDSAASQAETDPIFLAWDKSTGISITESQISDLGTYLTGETDPVFSASSAFGITGTNITNWGTAYGWGNHSGLYDSTGTASGLISTHQSTYNHSLIATALQSETDPVFLAWDKSTGISITESQISDLQSYLTAETDPVFGASSAAGITGTNVSNWNTAYSWNNHAGLYDTTGTAGTAVSTHESSYNHLNYNTAYSWGNHATAGYLTTYTETDPIFSLWDKSTGISITESQISDFGTYLTAETDPIWTTDKTSYSTKAVADTLYLGLGAKAADSDTLDGHDTGYFQTALGFTPYNSTNPAGYISSYLETDPVFGASSAAGIIGTDLTNWNSKESALTFSTGLTRNVNTITVNTSQNIDTLSNLIGNGFVKTSGGTGALSIDTNIYLTGNQAITLSGDIAGNGTTSILTTLPNINSDIGAFNNLTINAKGQVTAGSNVSYLTAETDAAFTGWYSSGSPSLTDLTLTNQLISTLADGTTPMQITSTTKVANLNADLLDGFDSSAFGDATAANQTTILSRIGTAADGAAMDTTLFAGQQMISDTLGTNDADNTFDSSSVVANADGSVIERLEQIQSDSSFKCGEDTITDADSNAYATVQIGTQCWQASNMRTTKYPGGASITRGPTGATWDGTDHAYYAYPPNVGNTAEENDGFKNLGYVYQWSAAMNGSTTEGTQGICPTGWHIPTDAQQHILEAFLADGTDDCSESRSSAWGCNLAGTSLKANGMSKFNAPLAGGRGATGAFVNRATNASFWSSSQSGSSAWDSVLVFKPCHGLPGRRFQGGRVFGALSQGLTI